MQVSILDYYITLGYYPGNLSIAADYRYTADFIFQQNF